jgi:hypothetical protein
MRLVARRVSGLMVLVVAMAGCGPSRPARITPPGLDVAAVTAAVMARADTDGDGRLTKQELERVPALVAPLAALDADADGQLSAAELRAWLEEVKASRVAITSLNASVTHKGKPLSGAAIRLVPESFMGGRMKAAAGVTEAGGDAILTIPDSPYPGVHCGLYRVEITGAGHDGKPLPARYNTESTLGLAVGGRVPENGMAFFTLE